MGEVIVDGVRLVYESAGVGDPVVLVCGTGQPAMSWSLFQVPALTAAGYRVVTFDNRGIPPSDMPPAPYSVPQMVGDLAAVIETLGLGRAHVAGLSLGAFLTQELALARPDLVRSAVMMGTFGRQSAFLRALMESWVEVDRSGIELPRIADAVAGAFAVFSPGSLADDEAMRAYLDFTVAAPAWANPGRLGQHEADLGYDDRLAALGGITVPCLVVGFEQDLLTTTKLCREVADTIPGCRYVEVAAAAHSGPFERPDEVNRALLDFFAANT
jgi:pimeloyl-ACP methyl ester carboxylesterase